MISSSFPSDASYRPIGDGLHADAGADGWPRISASLRRAIAPGATETPDSATPDEILREEPQNP
jgi:hypothetical protein